MTKVSSNFITKIRPCLSPFTKIITYPIPLSKPNKHTFGKSKVSFETRNQPTTATAPPSPERKHITPEKSANMPSDKPAARTVPSLAHTIDSVLSTAPAKQLPVRPLAKLRPSWIGPPPPDRPKPPSIAPAMKQHVNVEYSSPGLEPPVHIFTSLSDPQWEAVEMSASKNNKGEYIFSKAFDVEEGEYQYKFRLGPGDWWVCDESRRTVDDGVGNKNNLLIVEAPTFVAPQPPMELKGTKAATAPKPPPIVLPDHAAPTQHLVTPAQRETVTHTPTLGVEVFIASKGSESQQTPEREVDNPFIDQSSLNDVDPVGSATKEGSAFRDKEDADSASSSDSEDEGTQSPLLRHELVYLHSHEQEHAPLFRHESIVLGYNHHEPEAPEVEMYRSAPSKPMSPGPHVHWRGENKNPNLEDFPTDVAGILEKIRHASSSLPNEDATDTSPESQVLSETPISPISLPSVQEADEELTYIRHTEEMEFIKEEESGEEMDPLREVETEPEDEDFEPKVQSEEIVIEQTIVVKVIDERRKSIIDTAVEKVGGRNGVIAISVSVVIAIVSMIAVRLL